MRRHAQGPLSLVCLPYVPKGSPKQGTRDDRDAQRAQAGRCRHLAAATCFVAVSVAPISALQQAVSFSLVLIQPVRHVVQPTCTEHGVYDRLQLPNYAVCTWAPCECSAGGVEGGVASAGGGGGGGGRSDVRLSRQTRRRTFFMWAIHRMIGWRSIEEQWTKRDRDDGPTGGPRGTRRSRARDHVEVAIVGMHGTMDGMALCMAVQLHTFCEGGAPSMYTM